MTTVVYVSNAGSGTLSVLQLDETSGALSTVDTVEVGGTVSPLAIAWNKRFLYAARRSDPMAVATFAIARADGRLTPLGEAPLPASMAYIAIDRSGRYLLSASYPGNVIAVGPIAADGVARAVQQTLPTAPHAHAIAADASNRFVFATVLGGDHVMQLRFDETSGRLTPNDPPILKTRDGAGPRHLIFHPNGRFVYLLNELDASLDVLALDAQRGTLAHEQSIDTLPSGFDGKPWAADLHLTPDGRFLYSSERRSSTLAAFAVDAASGHLTLIEQVAAQAQPRGFAIDPSGRFVLTAGELSNRVGVHAIDAASGRLMAVYEIDVGRGPNWVDIVRLP